MADVFEMSNRLSKMTRARLPHRSEDQHREHNTPRLLALKPVSLILTQIEMRSPLECSGRN
jgi:hypothetical protein